MTIVSSSIGSRLRAEREARGIALSDVAEATKIPASLLEALERDDLARWPKGVYRRAFFRSYVVALGLPPEPLTREFTQLFSPDQEGEPAPAAAPKPAPHARRVVAERLASLRNVLKAPENFAASLLGALLELIVVLLAGTLLWRGVGLTLLEGIGVAALAFYPLVRALSGRALAVRGAMRHATAHAAAISTGIVRYSRPVAQTSGKVTATSVRAVVRVTTRGAALGARTLAASNYAFWCGVRTVASHAQALAARQLNRTTPSS